MSDGTERWLPVLGFEGTYEVSDRGRVRSVERTVIDCNGFSREYRSRIIAPAGNCGYPAVGLRRAGQPRKRVLVHRLVLEAFVGPCPAGMEGCHNDGDRANNHVFNLRWDTTSANSLDMVRHGTHHHARKTHCKHGHEFDEENTHINRVFEDGCVWRDCRHCWRDRKAKAKYARCA